MTFLRLILPIMLEGDPLNYHCVPKQSVVVMYGQQSLCCRYAKPISCGLFQVSE